MTEMNDFHWWRVDIIYRTLRSEGLDVAQAAVLTPPWMFIAWCFESDIRNGRVDPVNATNRTADQSD